MKVYNEKVVAQKLSERGGFKQTRSWNLNFYDVITCLKDLQYG